MGSWTVNRSKVLTKAEILAVLADLKRKSRRSVNTRMNLVLFRLACCCGLRASELTRLCMDQVRVGSTNPNLRISKAIAKGGRARVVPLHFDQGTLDDLRAWKQFRTDQKATGVDLFICSLSKGSFGKQIDRRNARKRFKACCRILGRERQDELTIHHGRHSFVSHALHAGRSIVEVKEAAGHSSIAITSIYAHVIGNDDGKIGNLFA